MQNFTISLLIFQAFVLLCFIISGAPCQTFHGIDLHGGYDPYHGRHPLSLVQYQTAESAERAVEIEAQSAADIQVERTDRQTIKYGEFKPINSPEEYTPGPVYYKPIVVKTEPNLVNYKSKNDALEVVDPPQYPPPEPQVVKSSPSPIYYEPFEDTTDETEVPPTTTPPPATTPPPTTEPPTTAPPTTVPPTTAPPTTVPPTTAPPTTAPPTTATPITTTAAGPLNCESVCRNFTIKRCVDGEREVCDKGERFVLHSKFTLHSKSLNLTTSV